MNKYQKQRDRAISKDWSQGRSEGRAQQLEELTGETFDYSAKDDGEPSTGDVRN